MLAHSEASQATFTTEVGLNQYYGDIESRLKSQGLMYLDIKGELFNKLKDNDKLVQALENYNEL